MKTQLIKTFVWASAVFVFGLTPSLGFSQEAQSDSLVYGTFIRNDATVYYCNHSGVTVTVDVTGGLDQPEIAISNATDVPFDFDPLQTTVSVYRVSTPSKKYRHQIGVFRLRKDDLKDLQRDTLTVLPYSQYVKKTRRSQFWADMFSSMIVGATYANDQQTSDIIGYAENERQDREREQVMKRIDEDYWRTNTILPHTSHKGFIAIQKLKADHLILDIPVNGAVCHFEILPNKVR